MLTITQLDQRIGEIQTELKDPGAQCDALMKIMEACVTRYDMTKFVTVMCLRLAGLSLEHKHDIQSSGAVQGAESQ